MPSAERTIIIMRPITEVFAFFSNPANDPEWRTHLKEVRADGRPGVGARVHQVIAGPAGVGIRADIEITGYEPERRYAFAVVAGPVRPAGEFRFEMTPEGGTEVTLNLHAELTGFRRVLMERSVQRSMDGEVAALDTAKRILEAYG